MSFFVLPLRIILFSLLCFSLIRVGLYTLYNHYFSALSYQEVGQAILTGIRFDSATVMLFFSPVLFILSLPFKSIQQSQRLKLFSGLYSAILLLMLLYSIVDIVYFGEVYRHIGADILNLSADKGAIIDIVLNSRLLESIIGILFLSIITLGYYVFIIRPISEYKLLPLHWIKRLLLWIGLVIISIVLFRGMVLSSRPINLSDAFVGSKLEQANLALNPVYTSYREIKNRLNQKPLKYVSEQELENFIKNNPSIFQWQNIANKPTGKNVVLILLESWSYKYIDGLSGSKFGATPFMDSLIKKSQVWDNFYAAGQRSIIGIQAILSSIPALPNQPNLGFGLELRDMSRIADIANQHQYRTVMMQSSARRSFHMDSIANALGFQEYYGKEDVSLLKSYPQEQPRFGWDYDALQFFVKKLSEPSAIKPFFAFMFTGTTHEPFPKIGSEFELYPYQAQGEQGFLNTLKYSDWAVQQFMQEAEKQSWYKDTIFIFTADHTLNTENGTELRKNFHIPLVIFRPDNSILPAHHQELASQYDLFPTMMDLMGFNQTISTFGKSLLTDKESSALFVNQGNLTGMLTKDNAIVFDENDIISSKHPVTLTQEIELKQLKYKMQYADQLLKQNRWKENNH